MGNSTNENQKGGQPPIDKNSIANIVKISTALGLGAGGLFGGVANSEVVHKESLNQTNSEPEIISYEVSQLKKIKTPKALQIRSSQIDKVINSAIRSRDINAALKGSKLSQNDKRILQRLSQSDLRQIGTLKAKLRGMDTKASGSVGGTGYIIF